jgi:hypothetical protein
MSDEDKKDDAKKKPRRRRRPTQLEYDDAWGGETDDRSTYNLGDGCRRILPKGAAE